MELLPLVRGCTFDDFLFVPQKGVLSRRVPELVDLSTQFSELQSLERGILSVALGKGAMRE